MLFFAVVYAVEGVGQARVGIIWQPLNHFLKETVGWTPVRISLAVAIFDLPWIIKPVFGLVSDFVPLFGYRRRAYLLLTNLAATAAYAWAATAGAPGPLLSALLATAFAMAIASTLCGALLVENGQRLAGTSRFVNQQWLWFNVAAMAAAIAGGQLVQRLSPEGALQLAALLAAGLPLAAAAALLLVDEQRAPLDLTALRASLRGLLAALRMRRLYLVAAFLFLYYFSPGFGTPLYFHLTDDLRFSQAYIGTLTAIGSAGWIVGAVMHRYLLEQLSTRAQLNLSIAGGVAATLAYLLLRDEPSAAVVYFLNGAAAMLANVATLTLAAETCPARAEGFVFAALMSVTNLATPIADTIGAFLYERAFGGTLPPLIAVSAAATAIVFLLVPLLRLSSSP